MRLTTVKLAGFKSFVDPTTLHLPTNMTGIVGPNGCGKSNIIDAVRWVMGESAASRLRGDNLSDVIFSGSSGRKPVGQAGVELIFDNSDGTIAGEYASYSEISVKRSASRDGQSVYWLNGTRCRRRDITDLFLGTGLGPRSYSIIEQGIISDIVESHPEQLRAHLEEAAGISKYKERRKETESRIKATRENLDRVRDVRDEVDKQLDHLNRQARAAERWQALKTEQTRREAELRALDYRALAADLEARGGELRAAELAVERELSAQREIEARLEQAREHQLAASEHHNAVQGEVYKVGAEIARVEQALRHHRELAERLQRVRQETETALAEVVVHLDGDRAQGATLRAALDEGEPRLADLRSAADAAAEALQAAEDVLAAWQSRWDRHTRDAGEAARAAEVERTRLDYLDRQMLELARRREALDGEHRGIDLAVLEAGAGHLEQDHDSQRAQVDTLAAALDARKAALEQVLDGERQAQSAQDETRRALQAARGRLASLEALQHAALGQDEGAASAWLQRHGLDRAPRLGAALSVEPGWERAVETVLGGLLEGVLIESPHALVDALQDAGDADLALLDRAATATERAGTLAARASGPDAALALLAGVRTAESLTEARRMVATVPPGTSVITAAGEWLGAGFVRIRRAQGPQVGVLARERELRTLGAEALTLEARAAELTTQIETLRGARFEAERARDDAQRDLYMAHRRLSELAGQRQSHAGKLEMARARAARLATELAELAPQLLAIEAQAREARARLDTAVGLMGDHEQQRHALESERRALLEAREEARLNARDAVEQAQQLALTLESRRAALAGLEQSLTRLQAQREQLQARLAEVVEQLAGSHDPAAELEAERQTCLDQRLLVDRQLVEARRVLEDCDAALRRLEQERHGCELRLVQLREANGERRLAEQALRLRADQLSAAIAEAGLDLATLLAELPADALPETGRQQLADLEQKIRRLEPVNLAAIQEHAEQSQRKNYLDAQLADLGSALDTLEGAIKKIDRETRQRFKDTFDRVNSGLQELFPRLFGGGHAYLELTGEDLLDAGVAIMARPPGKRVSNISLLSGGEKAMTAVALVFAIFQLNPAPFCILDEVDAPLDEANIGRFSKMVLEMSERVQFLFVTHNKGTMEAARQLCGVTMREPGVSRLVQVDLEEAAKLAGAA